MNTFSIIEIDKQSSKDLELTTELFFAVFTAAPWFDKWKDLAQAKKYIHSIFSHETFSGFLFYHEEKPVGFSIGFINPWYSGDEYYLREFGIIPSEQNKGYGKLFVKQIEEILSKRSCAGIILLTERSKNAFEFYKRIDFQVNDGVRLLYKVFKG